MPNNKSKQDAFDRILTARMGSGVDATDEYLLELNRLLHGWADDVAAELRRRAQQVVETPDDDVPESIPA